MEFLLLLNFGALVVIGALAAGLLYVGAMGVFTLNKMWHVMEDKAKVEGGSS
jgi:hypothetical protein